VRLARKDPAGARALFEKALDTRPNDIAALLALTDLDVQAGRGAQATTRLEAALATRPNDTALLTLLGRTYGSAKQFDKAESTLRRAITADPQSSEAFGWLGQLYMAQNQPERAVKEFETLARRRPDLVAPHVLMGPIYEQLGKREEAKEAYRRALALEPRSVLASNNLAFLYAQDNERLDEALELAQQAKSISKTPGVADTLGWVFYRKGLHQQAVDAFKEAYARSPKDTTFQYHLGMAYSKTGELRQARTLLEAALKAVPDAPEAAEAKSILDQLATIGS